MRIIWNNQFQAEFTPGEHWQSDLDSVKAAGFKTSGAPEWIWYALKARAINKLRKNKPLSGLILTELALQKYNELNQQEEQKENLKAQFKKERKAADKKSQNENLIELPTYLDEETGITCTIVSSTPIEIPDKPKFDYSKLPKCMLCDDPLFPPFDTNLICLWCLEKKVEKS